ncbi:MAG: 30S ribosomal protein S20 [Desulfobacterales bacterium]|nr:30S ribosomal protein S20 [Desulfobacterales bacterium]
MANHKSAVKRAKQSENRRIRNKAVKTSVKNAVKSVRLAVTNDEAEVASANLKAAISKIDKASKKGVIHANTAARKISRLTRIVNTVSA